MATVNKNFRIKNGLVVEGSTATVNGQNILTETGGDTYILNLVGGATLVKSVSSDFTVTGGGELQVNNSSDLARTGDITSALADYTTTANLDTTIDGYGYLKSADLSGYATESYVDTAIGNIDLSYTTDDVTEGSNLYFTNQRALDATSAAYDAAGAASTAQSNAETFATNAINALDSDDIEEGASNLYFTNQRALDATSAAYDAAGAASTAEANANTYTDNAINALDTDDIEEGTNSLYFTDNRAVTAVSNVLGTGLQYVAGQFSVDTSTIATQSYVNDAIDNLVDGAPGLLDTLNEIAAAINDDANYFTTVANSIAAKQDALTAGANIDITSNTISVTGLDTDDVSEGTNLYFTDSRARSAVDGTDRSFTSLEINEVSKEVAATTGNIATAAATTAYSWLKADYRSAKFLVKIKNGSHTEVSEVLVTLDTSDNVYLTEYGMSSTSGTSLGTISADVSGNDVRIRVTPANNNSEVMVAGSLLI
jgi:hypothetical protein